MCHCSSVPLDFYLVVGMVPMESGEILVVVIMVHHRYLKVDPGRWMILECYLIGWSELIGLVRSKFLSLYSLE